MVADDGDQGDDRFASLRRRRCRNHFVHFWRDWCVHFWRDWCVNFWRDWGGLDDHKRYEFFADWHNTLIVVFLNHVCHDFLTAKHPLRSILFRIVVILITGDTKDTAIFQFFRQGENVKVEKADFTLVPKIRRILLGSPFLESQHVLVKESLVPFAVNMPVLHRMRDVGRLEHVLQNDSGLAIDLLMRQIGRQQICRFACTESFAPTNIAQRLEVLIHNVRCHDRVHYQLAKALHVGDVTAQSFPKVNVLGLHE